MSNCEFMLALDRSDQTYRFGEEVAGFVEVRVESDCQCRNLVLEREWRTDGQGIRDAAGDEAPVPVQGMWHPGQVYRYPFRFVAPSGPATYRGYYLNVGWHLWARAETPLSDDASVEEEILLVPAEPVVEGGFACDWKRTDGATQVNLGPAYKPPPANEIREEVCPGTGTLLGGVFLLLIGLLSAVLLASVGHNLRPDTPGSMGILEDYGLVFFSLWFYYLIFTWPDHEVSDSTQVNFFGLLINPNLLWATAVGVFIALGFLLAGLIALLSEFGLGGALLGCLSVVLVALYLIYHGACYRRLGRVGIKISPVEVKRTGSLTCTIEAPARQPGALSAWSVRLSVKEVADSGENANRTHVAYERSFPMTSPGPTANGRGLVLQSLVTIPPDAPVTFAGWHNRLGWRVTVSASEPGASPWARAYTVTVYP